MDIYSGLEPNTGFRFLFVHTAETLLGITESQGLEGTSADH